LRRQRVHLGERERQRPGGGALDLEAPRRGIRLGVEPEAAVDARVLRRARRWIGGREPRRVPERLPQRLVGLQHAAEGQRRSVRTRPRDQPTPAEHRGGAAGGEGEEAAAREARELALDVGVGGWDDDRGRRGYDRRGQDKRRRDGFRRGYWLAARGHTTGCRGLRRARRVHGHSRGRAHRLARRRRLPTRRCRALDVAPRRALGLLAVALHVASSTGRGAGAGSSTTSTPITIARKLFHPALITCATWTRKKPQ